MSDALAPPPLSSGLGRGPLKAKTGVRFPLGALKRIELLDMPVEQFFVLIRYEDQGVLEKVRTHRWGK